MPAVDPQTRTLAPAVTNEVAVGRPLTRICPYLAAADGAWRSITVAREHRCGAVTPPAPLAAEKQRRLCLTPDYGSCTTFEAARAARPIAHDRAPTLPRPLARTTPVVLDHGRIAITVPAWQSERSVGQAVLIALMALAFAAIVLAKLTGGSAPAGVVGPSATPHGAASSSADGSSTPTTGAWTDPAASPAASIGGASSAAPGATAPADPAARSYKVKTGDTLIGIANRFGTTPKAIQKLNGISDPSSLKIGQVLKIP